MTDEGRMPYRERPEDAREFAMGDHGPFPGNAPSRPDDNIKRDVETQLFYDEAVSSIGIKVNVKEGVVTLDGTVESDQAKRLAGEDAWEVAGVRNVENNLSVQATPTQARAAGQGAIETKPPEAIYGEPPARQARTAAAGGSSGQQQSAGQQSGGQGSSSGSEQSTTEEHHHHHHHHEQAQPAGNPDEGYDPNA